MECRHRALLLVVLTLLQLCRAKIKDVQPQWYSANIINDGFQPISISELFSTERPFSTANPIIVSSKNSEDDILLMSTLTPPTSLSSTMFITSTTFPSSSQPQLSSFSPSPTPFPQYPSSPPAFQQYMSNMDQDLQSYYQQMNQPAVVIQQQTTAADFEPVLSIQPLVKTVKEQQAQTQRNILLQQKQLASTQNLPQNPLVTTFYQPQPTKTTMPQDMRHELVQQNGQTSKAPESSTARPPQTIPPLSNYFLIYQQAPQSVQNYPNQSSSPRTTVAEESFTTTVASPITSTLSPTFSFSTPRFSTVSSLPITMSTTPLFVSTTRPPSTQYQSTPTYPTVTVTSLSTIGSSSSLGSSTGDTKITNFVPPESTTLLPILNNGRPIPTPIDKLFPVKVRIVAPSGSITNINFNPRANLQIYPISTQKPIAYTTTRKQTKRRTPKPRRNTYERCLQGCRKNGQPLCGSPLSQFPVNPKTLRGFPSVCHMACHNSYRKVAFEKIIDGSCGRLRTRIRPIDSTSKLKKEELEKVQYLVDNSGQQAILEFTGAYS